MYERYLQRVFDLVVAAAATVLLSPVLALTSVAILLEDGRPVLFRQRRLGKDGAPFTVFKFRSMPVTSTEVPSALAAALRVTRVGTVIRRLNIDELPQLINVFRGEMSIVGPRPALPSQGDLCELRRGTAAYRCRPGLTGLAQMHSYDGMPDWKKARWDAEYAKRITFLGDCRIVLKTFAYLRRRPPVY